MDIDALLERVGYPGTPAPTAETLRGLHRAFAMSVPFENLDIHLGRSIRLDEASFFDKIVCNRRGGFCYELNGLFAAALRRLGFDVTLLSARVVVDGKTRPEFDHVALLVTLETRWLADVGFGDSFLEPLRLDDPQDQLQNGNAYRVVCEGSDWGMCQRLPTSEWRVRYRFTLQPRQLAEFAAMCRHHQTSPDSPFTRSRICSRPTPEGRITLADHKLIVTSGGTRRVTELENLRGYADALLLHFGIDLASVTRGSPRVSDWFSGDESADSPEEGPA